MDLESIKQAVKEEIEKLNHVLRLLEGRAKKLCILPEPWTNSLSTSPLAR